MKDTAYAYAVGSVRVRESALYTREELLSLFSARDEKELLRRLGEKGYLDQNGEADLAGREREVWEFVSGILPDEHALDPVLIVNDFHNLKVFVKALVAEKDPTPLVKRPCLFDPDGVKAAVFARENDKLPAPLRHADRSAYRILTKTGFAQLADSVVDRAALEHAMSMAKEAGDETLVSYTEAFAAAADLRVLRRCITAGKEASFMQRAVAATPLFDKDAAIAAAAEGESAFLAFLRGTPLAPLGEALAEKDPAFESLCDAFAAKTLAGGTTGAFGVAPVLRYYLAALAEIGNVRILLSGKKNGIPDDTLKERMRFGYV